MSEVLTVDTLAKYLVEHHLKTLQSLLNTDETVDPTTLSVSTIMGGNVNYAFMVKLSEKLTMFCKQAPEYVAIFGPDGLPLTSERMQREMDVYEEWKGVCPEYLPTIHFFDAVFMTVGMEFLEGYTLLDHVLVANEATMDTFALSTLAAQLGEFMGQAHAATHASRLDTARVEYFTQHFENRPMRDIQLEFVFTKCYKESTEAQRVGLNMTDEFLKEIETLKREYNGQTKNLVLCHGDFHPGSVMVSPDRVKVIDPEFTVYGPPGLDVGSLLSGYVLGAVHQGFAGQPDAAEKIISSIEEIWESYVEALKKGGLKDEALLHQTEVETVGFTAAEVCRTALEFAGGRKWLQFEDASVKAASNKAALELVDACMVARHENGMQVLLAALRVAVGKGAVVGGTA